MKKHQFILASILFPLFGLSQTGPGGVNTNNEFWVLANSGITLSGNDVSTWSDSSGNGNDATQSVGSERPSLSTSAINYNPAVYFDGTDEHLDINDLIASGSNALHAFAIGTNESGGDTWHTMMFGQGSTTWTNGGYAISALNTSSTEFGFWVNHYSNDRVLTGWINEPFSVIEGKYDGANVELLMNSESLGTDSYSGTIGDNGSTHLGGGHNTSYNHKGFISEVAIYSSALSVSDRAKINSYFGIKYSLTQNRGGIAGKYISSSGDIIFFDNGVDTYWNDIIGLARDDNSALIQKQSQTPDDTTRIYISNLATDNASNTGNFSSDNQFVVMGHNSAAMRGNGSTEFPSGLGIFSRIDREWKITNSNFNGTFSIDMKLNTTPINPGDLRILLDVDSDLSAGASLISPAISYSNGILTISGLSTTDFPINSTNYFTVVSLNSATPLPIELVNFTAKPITNDRVQLNWQTASEINNDYFIIERSKNVKDWQELNKIDGAGYSSSLLNYESIDNTPHWGTSYYRLKQIDFDGRFSYSQIRSVKIGSIINTSVEIYPNPASNEVIITGNAFELEQIRVFNTLGNDISILTKIRQSKAGKTIIDLSNLPSGIYYVKTKTTTNKIHRQ